ncbi:hypothetical protein PF002_g7545 [Phytophthora fragariae]|uniref:Uncharacterized protein n=1 Tax=Phytophthora fragariae TaxID=53985 RepID=A0A6A4EKY2_9STRA|nr:hypothetical protein PF003_g23997 [Phytophthora fragariae]KAE9124550.1 hypothetical protein PF007_g6673 [Phytophthora fragariae]KAE9244877.1 hypothetical protein PF002_g7545 [Phytophthora fragariae]KAE9319542.1 hypothetical protein PF001_g5849 [Phytophthora fragariae]
MCLRTLCCSSFSLSLPKVTCSPVGQITPHPNSLCKMPGLSNTSSFSMTRWRLLK